MSTPTDQQDQGVWLTQEAHDRLQAPSSTSWWRTVPAMAAEINDRREEGDLKENGGYHAAKEEQGKQEGRIRQLTDLLRKARVGEAPTDGDQRRAGHGHHHRLRRRRRRHREVPARLPRDRRHHRADRLLPRVGAGRGDHRCRPGRDGHLPAPNGQRHLASKVVAVEPFVP